jgi:hypothetical protein
MISRISKISAAGGELFLPLREILEILEIFLFPIFGHGYLIALS